MKFNYKNIIFCCIFLLPIISSVQAQSKSSNQELLRHVVVVKFKTGTSNAQMQAIDNSFKNLAKLKMVRGYEWGLGLDEYDTVHVKHVYTTSFANKNDEAAYGKSPEHQVHIKLGADYIESVSAIDYFLSK